MPTSLILEITAYRGFQAVTRSSAEAPDHIFVATLSIVPNDRLDDWNIEIDAVNVHIRRSHRQSTDISDIVEEFLSNLMREMSKPVEILSYSEAILDTAYPKLNHTVTITDIIGYRDCFSPVDTDNGYRDRLRDLINKSVDTLGIDIRTDNCRLRDSLRAQNYPPDTDNRHQHRFRDSIAITLS